MRKKVYTLTVLAILVIAALYFGWGRYAGPGEPVVIRDIDKADEITIFWAKWTPADLLQQLAKEFTRKTGITVTIVQESWATWQDVFFEEAKKRGERFDMVIGDSQWLGRGSTDGHYVELTKWIVENEVDHSMTPASISGYSEYPKGSGHYWAVPVEGDAMGFSYRRDLFENPQEQEAFLERYGYRLTVPKTWFQLRDIAEFFYRPEQDLYGVLAWVEPEYDGLTMGVQSVLWAWGGHLGNQTSYKVQGILNSPAGVAALKFYKELNAFNNPAWHHYYLDKLQNSNIPMMEGKVAMAMGYFAINSELLDPAKNPYAESMGFFANPAGPEERVSSLGGQGISIVSHSKKKEQCFQFLEWFVKEETQQKWSEMGGLTCNKAVLASSAFLDASPINRPFKESIEMVRDFWAVPEYPELLSVSQKHWHDYIVEDRYSAREALDRVAFEWEEIFERYGYYKE